MLGSAEADADEICAGSVDGVSDSNDLILRKIPKRRCDTTHHGEAGEPLREAPDQLLDNAGRSPVIEVAYGFPRLR